MGNLPSANDFWGWVSWILQEHHGEIVDGMVKTLVIATISTAVGCLIGFAVGLVQSLPAREGKTPLRRFGLRLVQWIFSAYIEIFRGTPMMVQAAFLFYGAALLFDLHMNMWFASLFIVSINTGAYMAETVRGGILSVDPGQMEGALSIGMTRIRAMRFIILPQAFRNILPQIGNNLIINIKDTCVLSIIGVMELFYTMRSITGATYAFFPAYSIAMVAYFLLTFLTSRLLRLLERKLEGEADYELSLSDGLVQGEGMPHYRPRKQELNADFRSLRQAEEKDDEKGDAAWKA